MVFPAVVSFFRYQPSRLRGVTVYNHRAIYHVRRDERVFFQGTGRSLRRVHRLLFQNLSISNGDRFGFREDVLNS